MGNYIGLDPLTNETFIYGIKLLVGSLWLMLVVKIIFD